MSCLMKYRVKGTNEWEIHEDGNERRCLDYLKYLESAEDIEY